MIEPPFFWRGADAVADFTEWQTAWQRTRDEALIAEATCPVVVEDDD